MIQKLFPYVCYAMAFALVMPLVIEIAFIGPLFLIPFSFLLPIYNKLFAGNFLNTGEHVEIGFAWINLNSDEARLFYISFFFFIGISVTALKLVSLLVPRLDNRRSFLAMVIFFIFLLPSLLYLASSIF